MSVERRIAVES